MANRKNKSSGRNRRRHHVRRGALKPGRWQVRLMISVPAVLILLCISMGLAYYISAYNLSTDLEVLQQMTSDGETEAVIMGLRDIARTLPARALVWIFIFCLLALLLGLGLVFSILMPLRQITDAAATIARGRIQHRVNIRAGFELGELGRNFNSMVGYINSMIEQRDALLKQESNVGTMTVNENGCLTTISPYGLDLLRTPSEELIGESLSRIRTQKPDLASGLFDFAHDCYVAYQSARQGDASRASEVLPDQPVEIEMPDSGSDSDQVLSVSCSALRDESNELSVLIFHFRDAVSLRNLNDLFSQTDQLAALGTFTFGLSHELRNPLGAIKGTVQLLEESIGEDAECRPYLDRIVRETNRLDLLVRELYDFSRTPVDPRASQDINVLTRQAIREAQAGTDGNKLDSVDFSVEYAENLPRCVVQETRIVRAIANIVSNAYEHTPAGDRISVKTIASSSAGSGPVIVEITNTGSRIAEENMDKIFEPFFSTRERGTGLGLAIAYQSVLQNHGQLHAINNEDGVTFRFAFHRIENLEAGRGK